MFIGENFDKTLAYSLANACMRNIKQAPFFPVKTGWLRDSATYLRINNYNSVSIVFSGDVAPYVFSLEDGSKPHDIPNAFGMGKDFGIGGRFDGKFHPGSSIHQGFISRDSFGMAINTCLGRLSKMYNIVNKEG